MSPVFGFAFAAFLIALDQFSKWYVLENIFRRELGLGDPMRFFEWLKVAPERLSDISLTVAPFFNFTMVWNFGISFGFMQGGGVLLLAGISIIILGFIIWMWRTTEKAEIMALAMIIGGALGNVIDRVRFGAVADFLDFHWRGYHFPAFNVADAAISIGVALLVLHGLFFAKNRA